jgi:hypothetical protein
LKQQLAAVPVAMAFLLASPLCGSSIAVSRGLVDDQVIQRGADDRADIHLSGVTPDFVQATIEARILRWRVPVEGFDWSPIARAVSGRWDGEIRRVPVGGPYRIEVRVAGEKESAVIRGVLVGDLWLLGGQSNMEGHGDLIDVEQPHELVHSFDLADEWQVAEEPLHSPAHLHL